MQNLRQLTLTNLQRLLLFIAIFAMGGAKSVAAVPVDFLYGWTEVTSLPTNNEELSKYYYVIVEDNMMVGLGKTNSEAKKADSGSGQEDKYCPVYMTPNDPALNRTLMWTLEYDAQYEYGIRNVEHAANLVQSREKAAYRLQAEWEARQSKWTKMVFKYSDGTWTIQNEGFLSDESGEYGKNYWGSWFGTDNANRRNDGYPLAGNKTTETLIGKFKIYSIPRTNLIANPSFEANDGNQNTGIHGWTNDGYKFETQNNVEFQEKSGTYYAQRWHVNGSFDINQTLTAMPAGRYKLSAQAQAGLDGKLYANDSYVEVNANARYEVETVLVSPGNLKIGFSARDDGNQWTAIDNVQLEYLGPSLIKNPSFEVDANRATSITGWNNDGTVKMETQSNASFGNKDGSYYAQEWHQTGTIDLNQTIENLPAGVYRITAFAVARDIEGANIYANYNTTNITGSTSAEYSVTTVLSEPGSIKLGIRGTSPSTGDPWLACDNFRITYLGASATTADLATMAIGDVFIPSATLSPGMLSFDNKLLGMSGDCPYRSGDGIMFKNNRYMAFKVPAGATIKVTARNHGTGGARDIQLGSDTENLSGLATQSVAQGASDVLWYKHETGGVVYLSASSDLYLEKIEIVTAYSVSYMMKDGGVLLPTALATALPNTLPTPTVAGYTFDGWYTNVELTNKATAGEALTGNITLYAKLNINKGYTVPLDKNNEDVTLTLDHLVEPQRSMGVTFPVPYESAEDIAIPENIENNWTFVDGIGNKGLYGDFREAYQASSVGAGDVLTQAKTGLENGIYEVVLDVAASATNMRDHKNDPLPTANNRTQAFAGNAAKYIPVLDRTAIDVNNDYDRIVLVTEVTDGTLTYGLRNTAASGNWYLCRVQSIKKITPADNFLGWYNQNGVKVGGVGDNYSPNYNGITLTAQYAQEFEYTLNAIDAGGKLIREIESGTTTATKKVYFPIIIEADGKFYRTSETTFCKTFEASYTGNAQTQTVTYTLDPSIVAFVESGGSVLTQNESYSMGDCGFVATQNYKSRGIDVGTLEPGTYQLVAKIIDKAFRGVTLRDCTAEGDHAAPVIREILSGSGVVTSSTFNIINPTFVRLNGKDSDSKSNQSADFDYAYVIHTNGVVITSQPEGRDCGIGTTVPLSVTAVANYGNVDVTPNYQWYSNTVNNSTSGTPIVGATGSTYNFTTAQSGTTYYYCVVSYNDVSATSEVVEVTACNHKVNEGTIGKINNTDNYLAAYSPYYELSSGEAQEFTFINKGKNENSWQNWYMFAYDRKSHQYDSSTPVTYMGLRADRYDNVVSSSDGMTLTRIESDGTQTVIDNPDTDAHFKTDMKDATVSVKVARNEGSLYIYAKSVAESGRTYVLTYSKALDGLTASDPLYLAFSVEKSHIENFVAMPKVTACKVTAATDPAGDTQGTVKIKSEDGIEVLNEIYVNEGETLTFTATPNSGYGIDYWTSDGTDGRANKLEYTINSIDQNTIVTAVFRTFSFELHDKAGILTKTSASTYDVAPTVDDLGGATVTYSVVEVIKDASSNLSAVARGDGSAITVTSAADGDGGAVVIRATVSAGGNTTDLEYVLTVPYIGNHTWQFNNLVDRPEQKSSYELGYEVIEGARRKDPIVIYKKQVSGDNARLVELTNGLYVQNHSARNWCYAVTASEGELSTIDQVRGVSLIGVKNTTLTIPQVKQDWFIKIYLDPHAGGAHGSGAGTEFTVNNLCDLTGKEIDPDYTLVTNGVQGTMADLQAGKINGCMIFRVKDDGDVKFNFSNRGWDKLVKIVVTDTYSTEMMLGADPGSRNVDYQRWNHNWVHRVKADGTDGGVNIYYNGSPVTLAENAKMLDFAIGKTEGTVAHGGISQPIWRSPGGASYRGMNLNVTDGVGNIKVISNATYNGDTYNAATNIWTTQDTYVLNRNETWIVVGQLNVQNYPYTWDFENYNVGNGNAISTIERKFSSTEYGAWATGYKTNKMVDVYASTDASSPFYSMSTGSKLHQWNIHKPLFANGAQLTCGTEPLPETKGLGIWINQAYYAGWNFNKLYNEQLTFDGSKLAISGASMSITIPDVKRKEAGKPMFVFVKASKAVTASNTIAPTVSFAPYAGNDGAVVSVFQVDTDDQTEKDVVINVPANTSIFKIGVTDQVKSIAYYGYATESRAIPIDYYETRSFSADMSAFFIKNLGNYQVDKEVGTTANASAYSLEPEKYVPAGTGIILKDNSHVQADHPTKADKYNVPLFVPANNILSLPQNTDGNLLVASTSDTQPYFRMVPTKKDDATQYFTMSNYYKEVNKDNEAIGPEYQVPAPCFYRYVGAAGNMTNNAYLVVDGPVAAKAIGRMYLSFDEEEMDSPTEVEAVVGSDRPMKEDGVFYSINGLRLAGKPTKAGVYIVNGKKISIK